MNTRLCIGLVVLLLAHSAYSMAEQSGIASNEMPKAKMGRIKMTTKQRLIDLLKEAGRTAPISDAANILAAVQRLESSALPASVEQFGQQEAHEIIALLCNIRTTQSSANRVSIRQQLLALGDTNEIERVVSVHRAGGAEGAFLSTDLAQCRQPLVIQALAGTLFIEEPVSSHLEGDIMVDPPSISATRIINSILVECSLFSDVLRAWSRDLLDVRDGKRRDILRLWWRENEELFMSRAFARVRPLARSVYVIEPSDYIPTNAPGRKIN